MCKFNPSNDGRRIDPCMKKFIENLKGLLPKDRKIVSCCCGHFRYPMTIVIQNTLKKHEGVEMYPINYFIPWDLVSGIEIPRKKKFYKKDKQGYYYIPEVINGPKTKI